jgi:uncharacterized protein
MTRRRWVPPAFRVEPPPNVERSSPIPNPVVHFEVVGKDGPALQKFYGDLFEWKINADNPMNYGIVEPSDGGIGGGVSASPDGNPMITWYVQVDDLQAALDKAEQLGGKTVMPPMDIPDGPKIALFTDPAGNTVGLVTGM